MIAVFKTGGKQYAVKPGQILKVEKIEGKKGDNLSFNNILVISDGSKNTIGTPLIKGALIKATIINQIKDKKIIVFNKRRRKNYRLTQGHRQNLTVLKIESILDKDKKSSKSETFKKNEEEAMHKDKTGKTTNISLKKKTKPVTKKSVSKKNIKKTVVKKNIKSKK